VRSVLRGSGMPLLDNDTRVIPVGLPKPVRTGRIAQHQRTSNRAFVGRFAAVGPGSHDTPRLGSTSLSVCSRQKGSVHPPFRWGGGGSLKQLVTIHDARGHPDGLCSWFHRPLGIIVST